MQYCPYIYQKWSDEKDWKEACNDEKKIIAQTKSRHKDICTELEEELDFWGTHLLT